MEMDIQVERTAEALDQGGRTGLRGAACEAGFADQVGDSMANAGPTLS